jgi:HxlR-like helix-turn-helix
LTWQTSSSRSTPLVDSGVVERKAYQRRPTRYEYRLTASGRDLVPAILALTAWGDRWARPNEGSPILFVHNVCGRRFEPQVVCSECGEAISVRTVGRNSRSRWRCESRHADFGAASEGRNQAAQWSVSLSTSQLSAVENNLSRREVAISDLRATNCGRKHGVGLMRVFSGACPGVRVCQRCDGSQSPVVVLSLARVSADRVVPGRRAG